MERRRIVPEGAERMVEESKVGRRPVAWLVPLSLVLLLLLAGRIAPASGQEVRLTDAAERGTFNVGPARAEVQPSTDPKAGALLRFDFTIPQGAAAGVWTKKFPEAMREGEIDVVRPAARSADPAGLRDVGVTLEIKGSAGVQRIPIELHHDWASAERSVDWKAIGSVSEVVVSVARIGDGPPATGTIDLDIRFERLPFFQRLAAYRTARFGGVLLVGLLLAALGARPLPKGALAPGGFLRDAVLGVGAVGVAAVVVGVYALGSKGPMEVGWHPLVFAGAGAALAAWWTFALCGRGPTRGEIFRDALATGLLAASSSPSAILQPPAEWSDLFALSAFVAAAAVGLYHVAKAVRLATAGKSLGWIAGGLIVGTPYAVGSLTLLESAGLIHGLGDLLGGKAFASRPEIAESLGRVAVLFAFNELVANALGLATKRTPLKGWKGHLAMLSVAIAAVAGPWIAAMGSGEAVASWPPVARAVAVVAATIFSQAGLWAEGYLLTGFLLDALAGRPPTADSSLSHPILGARKGMVYSGTFMALLSVIALLADWRAVQWLARSAPLVLGLIGGAVAFPLGKAIIETFDGSQAFFRRVGNAYRDPMLYARGAIVGAGLAYGLSRGLPGEAMSWRIEFGFAVGLLAFAGVNLLRDGIGASTGRYRVQPVRSYVVLGLLGGFIGAAIGFYLDSVQVAVVVSKFHEYVDPGQAPRIFDDRILLSKWGLFNLGTQAGGPSLLFDEALAGVITWSIPSWLFAINRTFLAAYFDREAGPIKALFTRAGLLQLVENMIGVLRWGLWMSPIIKSFLRPMGDPTWYNQDGAIRTVVATVHDLTSSPQEFRAWSLGVFISLLAYDSVRILIWLDHFGLRVSTLVNLSFLGMDRLDRRLARFLAPESTSRCIPEGVKRFTTWAPLLIPFYIPRGKDWDTAWSQAETLRSRSGPGPLAEFAAMPVGEQVAIVLGAVLGASAVFAVVRLLRSRSEGRRSPAFAVSNLDYEVTVRGDGDVVSTAKARGFDISRRSYDLLDPAGRAIFVVDPDSSDNRPLMLVGNAPGRRDGARRIEKGRDSVVLAATGDAVRASAEVRLAGPGEAAEIWTIAIENLSDSPKTLKVVAYLEWVLNRADADRGHTQYNRLFAEVEYVSALRAVLAWDKHAKAMGVLAADVPPDGFLSARVDFLGRGRVLADPRALETFEFFDAVDTDAHPTLDPIAALLLNVNLPPRGTTTMRLLIGMTGDKRAAIDLIAKHLDPPGARNVSDSRTKKESHPIRHGEIPPGTPDPYVEFSDDGRKMLVRTPFTPRPFDHTLSNALGHVVSVTNRGLNTSSSVNAQQNRLTPDWPDIVTREVPPEAFYLHDPASGEWFSPTYHPLNDAEAENEAEFGVDGTAVFRMTKGDIDTELTVFVPPDDPLGVYLLTIRNRGDRERSLRVASYFQMVLAGQPEFSGPLQTGGDDVLDLTFVNPRNTYRTGPAFVAMRGPRAEAVATSRGRFFGPDRDLAHPAMVAAGKPSESDSGDDRPVAAMLASVIIPARGEETLVVLLGQADDRDRARQAVRKYGDEASARAGLEATKTWWLGLMETLSVRTESPEFDRYLDWLKYQALAERIWARRGFYQASGAFGFRDQLQDSVNLIWMDPSLARKQILLNAAQQFLEGDVVHWFHLLQDGRTGFVGRTHASDNLLWLSWAVVEYVDATGDESLLAERVTYLESDLPFEPLPAGKGGMGFDPLRSSREDSIYRHAMKSIDLVLDRRMGVHGLPLMGTGDWNDGLDEIGSEGKGESVWLGFFLYYLLDRMVPITETIDGPERRAYYAGRLASLKDALESTWRGDRYLRAFHDDGTEIGVKGSGIWEIDALTAGWAVMSGINPGRGRTVFETALATLETDKTILLGWPPLREDSTPYLGRSSGYPEGVRENGMYCHGVQWLVGAARILAKQAWREGREDDARRFVETAGRLWRKIAAISHAIPGEIETYGGQPNQQAADMVTTFEPGRMIWNGYTGAAGWMFRQAIEGVLGLRLIRGEVLPPDGPGAPAELEPASVSRDVGPAPRRPVGRAKPTVV